jgi:hypothetical protein
MSYLGNSPGIASQRVESSFTATAGQTVFIPLAGYTIGYCDVFLNGVKLVNGDDYTAADGVSVVLDSGAAVGDTLEVLAYFPRGLTDGYTKPEADGRFMNLANAYSKTEADGRFVNVANAYTKTESDGRFLNLAGGVLTGQLTVGGNLLMSANSGGVRTLGMPSNSNTTLVIQGGAVSGSSANIELTNNNDCFVDATITRFRSQDASTTFAEFMSSQARILTGNVERMRVDSTGNVGIGTSSPGQKLDVDGNIQLRSGNRIGFFSQDYFIRASSGLEVQTADFIRFLTSGATERMRIDSAGRVGIGTSSPAYKCVIQDNAGETILGLNSTSSGGKHYLLISGGSGGSYAGGKFGLYSVSDGVDLMAATSNTGSTAGGTTGNGVGFSNAGFWVDRGWANFPSITVCNTNYAGNTNQSQLRIHGTNATYASYPSSSGSDFGCSLYIDGTYQTGSDRRFKTNISDIDNALGKVMLMSGKRYQTTTRSGDIETGITENGYRFGFIAQDLQDAGLDELYKHNAEEDDGTDGYNKAYSVEYDAVVPLLVNAIKEQQAIINELKADVALLKGAQP